MQFNFRNLFAFFVAAILIALGFVKRAKKKASNGEYILSVYFHSPGKKMFETIIKWFLKNGFHFISIKDLDLIIKGERAFPRGAVILTVDDGWLSNEENIVSVVHDYKIPVAIFISTEPVENGNFWWSYISPAREKKLINYTKQHLKKISNKERLGIIKSIQPDIFIKRQAMTIVQVKNIAASKYVTIGAHTVSHPILTKCEDVESFNEIKNSKIQLEDWLQSEINTFAYPNGSFSKREVNYLDQLNFSLAFTTEEFYLTPKKLSSKYELPRFYVNEDASILENLCRMTGVWLNKNHSQKQI